MKSFVLSIFFILILIFFTVRLPAQTAQVSPVADLTSQNTSVVNNNIQILQTGINGVVGLLSQYFSNGVLNATNGGTGQNSSAWVSGDTVIMTNRGVWGHKTVIIPNQSNVLFQYNGEVDKEGSGGEITDISYDTLAPSGKYRFLAIGNGDSNDQIWSTKYTHIAGITTVTVWCRLWGAKTGATNPQAGLAMTIGGLSGSVNAGSNVQTPTWYSFTINVSSLTPGNTYDVIVNLLDITASNNSSFCSNIMAFGS